MNNTQAEGILCKGLFWLRVRPWIIFPPASQDNKIYLLVLDPGTHQIRTLSQHSQVLLRKGQAQYISDFYSEYLRALAPAWLLSSTQLIYLPPFSLIPATLLFSQFLKHSKLSCTPLGLFCKCLCLRCSSAMQCIPKLIPHPQTHPNPWNHQKLTLAKRNELGCRGWGGWGGWRWLVGFPGRLEYQVWRTERKQSWTNRTAGNITPRTTPKRTLAFASGCEAFLDKGTLESLLNLAVTVVETKRNSWLCFLLSLVPGSPLP